MKTLIDAVSVIAPTLGRILAGPLGEAAVKVIADQFGSKPNEEAIIEVIKANPELAQQQLAYLEQWAQAETARWQGQSTNASSIAEVYKLELQRGGFWSWLRPMCGWVTIAQSALFSVLIVKHVWEGKLEILGHVPMLVLFMTPLAAIMGVYFWNRSQERQALVTNGNSNVFGTIRDFVAQEIKRGTPHQTKK